MEEFILAECSEIVETLHAYGDITSEKCVYIIIARVDKDGDVFIKNESGIERCDHIEFEEDETPVDFHKSDYDLSELQRFMDYIKK